MRTASGPCSHGPRLLRNPGVPRVSGSRPGRGDAGRKRCSVGSRGDDVGDSRWRQGALAADVHAMGLDGARGGEERFAAICFVERSQRIGTQHGSPAVSGPARLPAGAG